METVKKRGRPPKNSKKNEDIQVISVNEDIFSILNVKKPENIVDEDNKEEKVSVFDLINDLSYSKKNIFLENESEYNPFVVNKAFSLYSDTVLLANEMNINHFLSKKMQNDFYFHSIRSRKRFSKWPKPIKNENFDLVQQYYKYNYERTMEALKILSDNDIENIKLKLRKGGTENELNK